MGAGECKYETKLIRPHLANCCFTARQAFWLPSLLLSIYGLQFLCAWVMNYAGNWEEIHDEIALSLAFLFSHYEVIKEGSRRACFCCMHVCMYVHVVHLTVLRFSLPLILIWVELCENCKILLSVSWTWRVMLLFKSWPLSWAVFGLCSRSFRFREFFFFL